jgi:hypothetical protein
MRTHRVFGATLASDFPFHVRLTAVEGSPDLTFTASLTRPASDSWESRSPIYRSPHRRNGNSLCHLHQSADCEVLSFPEVSDFYLWPDRIVCHLPAPELRHIMELNLLGPVFAYWLERRAFLVLHASAVTLGHRAVAFGAHHGRGKSGVAAALMQSGGSLLNDDLVPLEARAGEILVHPSFPQMRMWPDEASFFLQRFEHLPLVHPNVAKLWVPVGSDGLGTFHEDAMPLTCIYLLDRRPQGDAPVEILEISPRDAVIELLRHSFTPLLVEAAGLQPARFDLLSRLVLQVPVKRLRYPSGFDRLSRVTEVIQRDLEEA